MPSPVQQALAELNRGRRKPRIPRARTNLSASRRIERQLQRRLTRVVEIIADDIRRRLVPVLPEFEEQMKLEARRPESDHNIVRADQNIARRLAEILAATRVTLQGTIPPSEIEAQIRDQGFEFSNDNKRKVGQAFRVALGVDLFLDEPFLENTIENYVGETTALIRNVGEELMDQTERVVLQGLRQGVRHEDIARQLIGLKDKDGKPTLFSKAKNRAKLVARDQANKLNGKLTELRQQRAGIEEYTWRTVGDDRVRPEHVARDGKKFNWNEPPSDGHPGEPVNCRCYAEPVFDV